jgi:hypothetical protein
LYADAFLEQPSLADDLTAQHRYNAAYSAALVACGKGTDADHLRPTERLALRLQALTWLRADLAAWSRLVALGEVGPGRLARTLRHWQKDADLAAVRNPEALGKLPAEEQVQWRKLWADVAALLAQTKPGK